MGMTAHTNHESSVHGQARLQLQHHDGYIAR